MGKGKKDDKKYGSLTDWVDIGMLIKAKIELILAIIATKVQIKFFIVAIVGLIINIASFYIGYKRGDAPQQMVCILISFSHSVSIF